ncbi:MAG: hypothetical protein Q4A40_02745 [Bacillota bacterium]|nr:hypothetical protein [Bacillota bacterium]
MRYPTEREYIEASRDAEQAGRLRANRRGGTDAGRTGMLNEQEGFKSVSVIRVKPGVYSRKLLNFLE